MAITENGSHLKKLAKPLDADAIAGRELLAKHLAPIVRTLERAAEAFEMDPTHLAKIEAGTINISFRACQRV